MAKGKVAPAAGASAPAEEKQEGLPAKGGLVLFKNPRKPHVSEDTTLPPQGEARYTLLDPEAAKERVNREKARLEQDRSVIVDPKSEEWDKGAAAARGEK